MIEDYENQKRRQVTNMRSIMDYIMGALFFLIGLYLLSYRTLNINLFNQMPSATDYLLGSLFVLYGGWRMYRGYKKNYFK